MKKKALLGQQTFMPLLSPKYNNLDSNNTATSIAYDDSTYFKNINNKTSTSNNFNKTTY